MPLRLYNTLTKRLEPLVPKDPAHVTFYTCGPTVYDDAHIGNFRSFLAADLLRRFIESPLCELADSAGGTHKGPRRVTHVMNITDVGHMTDDAEGGESGEDRMAVAGRRLAEAKKSGKLPAGVEINPNDPYQIARFYEERFRDDARKLGLKLALEAQTDASLMPRATDNVPGMIEVVKRLVSRGHAYVVGQPGSRVVYFDVRSFEPYGRLSGNTLERLKEGEGGRISASNQASKRHPADFLLWKEDTSHIMKWDSPWGAGYPGWHIECTVMSVGRLLDGAGKRPELANLLRPDGESLIDLHSGGEDNIFPHHECEIAQSCCAFNESPAQGSFARLWFHPRFLLVEGTKMSKSKGNFFTARDLFARGIEPAALRLELIKTHYRSNANFTMQGLTDSQRQVRRWMWRLIDVMESVRLADDMRHARALDAVTERVAEFSSALMEDMNVALALAILNGAIDDALRAMAFIPDVANEGFPLGSFVISRASALAAELQGTKAGALLGQLLTMLSVIGVFDCADPVAARTSDIGVFAPGIDPDPKVEELLRQRRDARAAKDFKASDAIRDQLAAMGYAIKDAKDGKVEVSRKT